jgi:uncharacterized protein with NRDE domain
MAYLCNKGECRLQEVPPGLHGITNGHLDAHWPKARAPAANKPHQSLGMAGTSCKGMLTMPTGG